MTGCSSLEVAAAQERPIATAASAVTAARTAPTVSRAPPRSTATTRRMAAVAAAHRQPAAWAERKTQFSGLLTRAETEAWASAATASIPAEGEVEASTAAAEVTGLTVVAEAEAQALRPPEPPTQ